MSIASYVLLLSAGFTVADSICSYEDRSNGYTLDWTIEGQEITFSLQHSKSSAGFWTGVAFGSRMSNLDLIEVGQDNGYITITDMHTTGWRAQKMDSNLNVNVVGSTSYVNGVLKASFKRALNTGDSQDKVIVVDSDTNCNQKWVFPVTGGRLSGKSASKHNRTPRVVSVCNLEACRASSVVGNTGSFNNRNPTIATTTTTIAQTTTKAAQYGNCPSWVDDVSWCEEYLNNNLPTYGCESMLSYKGSCCRELTKRGCLQ